jgi:hypothetical protein
VLLPLSVIAAIVLTPEIQAFHFSILTESLFISGLVAFLAAMTRFARVPTWRAALAAAAIAGLTASVRRTAVVFAAIVLLMVAMRWRDVPRRRLVLAGAIAPLLVIGAADFVISRAIHGDRLTSLTGPHLFAKAALVEAHGVDRPEDPLQARLARELEQSYAPVRGLLASAPRSIRASLTLYYETCLQGPCVTRIRNSLSLPEAATNAQLARAGAARIRRAPLHFGALTATHYESLWTILTGQHPDTAAVLGAFLTANRPLPFERETFKVAPTQPLEFVPWAPARWFQPTLLFVGLFTLVIGARGLLGAWRGTASPALIVAALASLVAHAGLLFSAVAAAGIARFMIGLFPAVVTGSAVGLWWMMHNWLRPERAPCARV